MIYKFIFNGVCKVPLGDREIVLDRQYITSDEGEINTLKSLKFRYEVIPDPSEKVEPEKVKVQPKPKAKPKAKKKADK